MERDADHRRPPPAHVPEEGEIMLKYISKKAVQMILMLLLISFLIFVGLNMTGVDPISYTMSPSTYNAETVERIRKLKGLNAPLLIRYFRWIGGMLRGDFGYSLADGSSIQGMLARKLPATLELAICSLLLSSAIGIVIGIISAVWQNGFLDSLTRALAVIGNSLPAYFLGLCLLQMLAIKLGWFPPSGRTNAAMPGANLFQRLEYLALPVIALTIGMCGNVMRYTRNTMLDVANREFVKTAYSKGLPEWKVQLKHVFRNSMRPVMVLIMLRMTMLVGGSVAIETIFNWPGIGMELTAAITSNDYPVVMIITLMIAAVLLLTSLLIDIFTALLDPRVRFDL
jgi:peptide/nickel transport system permease protein